MALSWPMHDPASLLDYTVDWSFALEVENDTITASTFVLVDENDDGTGNDTSELTIDHTVFTSTQAIVWLTAGAVGKIGTIENTITTAAGRQFAQRVQIPIGSR